MNNYVVEMDTRNKIDNYITDYFDKHGIKYIRTKLYAGDVKLLNSTKVIIDLKANVEEIAHNICNAKEHARILRELAKAKEIGCKKFIFMIKDKKVKCKDDLINWTSKNTKIKGSTLYKAMCTMNKKYGCLFMFVSKENAPKYVLKLLNKN